MNNEIILQSLIDAFEVLKDSWDNKSDAISKCIAETSKYDANLALDMWLYIMESHRSQLKKEFGADIVREICDKLYYAYNGYKNVALNICPALINKPELYRILYGEVCIKDNYDQPQFLLYCFAWILTEKANKVLIDILHIYNNNSSNNEFPIGTFMAKSVEAYKNIKEDFDREIFNENKEALFSFLENIKDKHERAECTIAFLSL